MLDVKTSRSIKKNKIFAFIAVKKEYLMISVDR